MKKLDKLKKELRRIGGNIILAKTPGYNVFFEEFSRNVWRLNIFVDMNTVSLKNLLNIKEIVTKIYQDYNLIISSERDGAMEYWFGEFRPSKNLLLNITPFSSKMIAKHIWNAVNFLNREVVVGEDFVQKIVNQNYDWPDFTKVLGKFYIPNFIFLRDELEEDIKLGMLKSFFLKFITSAVYCKGVVPKNREKIINFFESRFKNKKMLKIIENFYDNKYNNLEKAIEDVFYFIKEVMDWPGLRID